MLFILASYLLGTILTAALVAKVKGVKLHEKNSGNLGARNAGRTLGKSAFVIVAIGDGLKGLVVVLSGRLIDLPEPTIGIAVIAVVLGHLYPFWNKGKGGKGVATVIGAMLAFSPVVFLMFLAGFLISMLIMKSATLGMVGGFVVYGIAITAYLEAGIIVFIALVLVIWKQRHSIKERVMPNVLE
ncbi:glycerol-3-phosphate acyltransferase [Solibacillus silvestris]|uniref:glycerol-3-phosphate acyltransferase n=1 Tax=Solibacillus silvestris TaxID=76853 RepID=UPI003F81BD2E